MTDAGDGSPDVSSDFLIICRIRADQAFTNSFPLPLYKDHQTAQVSVSSKALSFTLSLSLSFSTDNSIDSNQMTSAVVIKATSFFFCQFSPQKSQLVTLDDYRSVNRLTDSQPSNRMNTDAMANI